MPLYELQLFRQRTVYDQALISVRAKSLEAAEEADIDTLDAEGKIDWNCEHYDETDDLYVTDVEEIGDDDDNNAVDVDMTAMDGGEPVNDIKELSEEV